MPLLQFQEELYTRSINDKTLCITAGYPNISLTTDPDKDGQFYLKDNLSFLSVYLPSGDQNLDQIVIYANNVLFQDNTYNLSPPTDDGSNCLSLTIIAWQLSGDDVVLTLNGANGAPGGSDLPAAQTGQIGAPGYDKHSGYVGGTGANGTTKIQSGGMGGNGGDLLIYAYQLADKFMLKVVSHGGGGGAGQNGQQGGNGGTGGNGGPGGAGGIGGAGGKLSIFCVTSPANNGVTSSTVGGTGGAGGTAGAAGQGGPAGTGSERYNTYGFGYSTWWGPGKDGDPGAAGTPGASGTNGKVGSNGESTQEDCSFKTFACQVNVYQLNMLYQISNLTYLTLVPGTTENSVQYKFVYEVSEAITKILTAWPSAQETTFSTALCQQATQTLWQLQNSLDFFGNQPNYVTLLSYDELNTNLTALLKTLKDVESSYESFFEDLKTLDKAKSTLSTQITNTLPQIKQNSATMEANLTSATANAKAIDALNLYSPRLASVPYRKV